MENVLYLLGVAKRLEVLVLVHFHALICHVDVQRVLKNKRNTDVSCCEICSFKLSLLLPPLLCSCHYYFCFAYS